MLYKRNIADVKPIVTGAGDRFAAERRPLTPHDQGYAPKLGMSHYRVPPGKTAFPFHTHTANDEAIWVLKGTATLRYGEDRVALEAGDYVHMPAASGLAHQIINTGSEDLEYVCVSSMVEPDVIFYPDSGKHLVMVGSAPGGEKARRKIMTVYADERRDYWDGEA